MVAAIASRLNHVDVTASSSPHLYQDSTVQVRTIDGHAIPFAAFTARFSGAMRFVAPVAVREMPDFLDRFGVLLHPDESTEVGATTVIEALRRGLIPVVSSLGALPELVGDAGVIVRPVDGRIAYAEKFAVALERLRTSSHSFEAARAARKSVLGTSAIVDDWMSVLL
jgi:glycosyltransferase involved in cell wall biosynthesis